MNHLSEVRGLREELREQKSLVNRFYIWPRKQTKGMTHAKRDTGNLCNTTAYHQGYFRLILGDRLINGLRCARYNNNDSLCYTA